MRTLGAGDEVEQEQGDGEAAATPSETIEQPEAKKAEKAQDQTPAPVQETP